MKKHIFLILFLLTILPSVYAKDPVSTVTVAPILSDADAANNGIIYSLPTTAIRINVEAELTIHKVGPFFRYSNKYLNLGNVITEDSEEWKIVSTHIEAFGTSNDLQRFKISTENANLPAISLTPDGVICGINTECTEDIPTFEDSNCTIPDINFDNIKLERSVLTKTSTAAMAEEAANAIYRLREKRQHLLGGDDVVILHDEGSYRTVLAEIDSLETEYLSLFIGKTETFHVSRTFTIIPDPRGMTSTVIARFSPTEGFLDVMNLNGKPIYADVTFDKCTRINELPSDAKERKKEPLTGLRYIIPCSMHVKVVDRNILLTEKDFSCSQNGQLATLPASILLNENVQIQFDHTNGSLKGISYIK